MPPSKRSFRDTIEALKAIIDESLKHPEKRQEFVDEGSIELIIEHSLEPWCVLRSCPQNSCSWERESQSKIVDGRNYTLLKLCDPELVSDDTGTTEDAHWRFLAHEQAAAVLHLVSFQNPSCQAEMVTTGAIKHLVRLCDVFNPEGCHSNCCQAVADQYSSDASKLLYDLDIQEETGWKVKDMTLDDIREKAVKLIRTGLVSGLVEVNKLYSIDLYDTTTAYQDVRISDELVKSQLMWPNMSLNQTDGSEDNKEKYVNPKDGDFRWADVYVTEVIDACHFWAHVGGKMVIEKMEAIIKSFSRRNGFLSILFQNLEHLFCVSEIIGGLRDSFRGQVLSLDHSTDDSLTVQVFAVDNGFTKSVSGVLRNLTEENNSYRLYIAAQQGLESLIMVRVGLISGVFFVRGGLYKWGAYKQKGKLITRILCYAPSQTEVSCKEAVGTLLNLAINSRVQARIGFLGGIQVLLDVCQRYSQDEEILLLAIGGIQNLVQDSYVNRCRLADSDGLIILSRVYYTSDSDAIKTRCLHAIKNLLGNSITNLENGVWEVTKSQTYSTYDTRSITDDRKKFSLAVTSDDEAPYKRERRRRRRR
ncbi:hypothetical protein OS493_014382 [Desmophyllum pertusum]|uniref:ARM repeat superfamily protein n=1 Tax=Desmophyllum pertusum TaxID=174260 RepID=A0A9W9YPH0_9CNID|nr:hypothetical protein OS493_014382 [Desmophyllum pertusum]